MQRILVATDGSPGGDRAVQAAATMAAKYDCALTILTVLEPPSREAVESMVQVEHVAADEVGELTAQNTLHGAHEAAKHCGARDIQRIVEDGDPATAILKIAARTGAGTIVVGKRGRGKLAGLLLGSVSQKLVSLAPVAVLVVP